MKLDPWLSPFREALRSRYSHAQKWIKTINDTEGGLDKFSKGKEKFGFVVSGNGDITYREWAPNALRAYLIGDFSTQHARMYRRSDADIFVDQTDGIGMLYL